MGFEAGFTIYPKFKDYSLKDIKTILSYIFYLKNISTYNSFEEYIDSSDDVNLDVLKRDDFDDAYEFYKDFNEWDVSINFCSEFRNFDDHLVTVLDMNYDDEYLELSKDNIAAILKYADDQLEDLPVFSIKRAYTYENEDVYRSFTIDGVELSDDHGIRRVDVANVYDPDTKFSVADDDYAYDVSVRLYHTLTALRCVDLRNNYVVYYRSW